MRVTGTGQDLARERCEAPLMNVAEPVCSVYVDNINVHGITFKICDRRHKVIIAALEARGFSLHEVSRASQHLDQLGVRFDRVARFFTSRSSSPLEGPSCSSLSFPKRWRARFDGPLGAHLLAIPALAVSAPSSVSVPGSSA